MVIWKSSLRRSLQAEISATMKSRHRKLSGKNIPFRGTATERALGKTERRSPWLVLRDQRRACVTR